MSSNIEGGTISPIHRQSFRPKVRKLPTLDMRPANTLTETIASSYPYHSQDRSTCQEKCNIRTLARSWGCRRRWTSRRACSATPGARASSGENWNSLRAIRRYKNSIEAGMDICKFQDWPGRLQVQYCISDREYGNFRARHRWTSGKARWKAYGRNDHGLFPSC